MEQAKVFFIKAQNYRDKVALAHKFKILIKQADLCAEIKKGELAAIKVTVGEKGNTGFVPPEVIKVLADKIKSLGAKPFVTDSNVLYHGRRSNSVDHRMLAYEHGFTIERLGCPFIVADGLLGENSKKITINKKYFKDVAIAGIVPYVNHLIGVSHFTGHMLANFGGTIKNLGMGLASRAGKLQQHSSVKPRVIEKNCTFCKHCIKECPAGAIIERKDKSFIKEEVCIGCGGCLVACKFAAVEISWSEHAPVLAGKMAEYALGAIIGIKNKIFINFAMHITKECDCMAGDDEDICESVGILASKDPVALDRATIDLIYKNKKGDFFKELHPAGCGYLDQLTHAENIGLGTMDYEIAEL
ncbi:MAG: DUF362 domain-containing protein [Candidatus Omnitrophota bacterium]